MGKSLREYFMVKSGAFHIFFAYVGESLIIIFPINNRGGLYIE